MDDFKQYIKSVTEINDRKIYTVADHMTGFDENYNNPLLDYISNNGNNDHAVINYEHFLPNSIKQKYNDLEINFSLDRYNKKLLGPLLSYNATLVEKNKIENFLCCFLGRDHVSRQFLSAILIKSKIWNNEYCRKDFSYTSDSLDGNISFYLNQEESRLYRKFFINNTDDINFRKNTIGYEHGDNVHNLKVIDNYFKKSFLALIPETIGTSFIPFITEKFLNAVVTKTLFVTYGQPNWHSTLENVHGFKLHNKIFDYSFDKIQNPIHRVIKLFEMISKFQHLSAADWHDLYLIEQDTIEYNYDHYYSKNYLKYLAKFA